MKNFKKVFAAIIFSGFVILSATNVEAADLAIDTNKINFQNLKSGIILPTLPDRIRHRKDSHKLQKPADKKIEWPHRKEQPPSKYPQIQPKKPSIITSPSRSTATSDRRGSEPRKNFGPPRFR